MRTISNFNERPKEIEVTEIGDRAAVFIRRDIKSNTVRDLDGEERIEWQAIEYSVTVNSLLFKPDDAFCESVIQKEYEQAAAAVRKKRDALLAASDSSMALDRLGLVVPSGSTFTAWLTFLRDLGSVMTGVAAKYRQALRDIPQQPGFPFDVEWPEL